MFLKPSETHGGLFTSFRYEEANSVSLWPLWYQGSSLPESYPPTVPFLSPTGVGSLGRFWKLILGLITLFTISENVDFNRRGFASTLQEVVYTRLDLVLILQEVWRLR